MRVRKGGVFFSFSPRSLVSADAQNCPIFNKNVLSFERFRTASFSNVSFLAKALNFDIVL